MKEVDNNGFWRIKNNPLSKEGVFPYLGSQISSELEPNKIYKVYRPMSEISAPETIESFDGIPLIDEHEMLGEGFTKYDDRPAGGIVYHTHAENGKLYGDIRIFSEQLKDEIESGKKELSMGYSCRYEPEKGVFNDEFYDFIQRDLRGNHVALVNRGRMGSDVRVYDQHITFDTLEGVTFEAEDENEIPSQDGSPKESGVDCSLNQQGNDSMEKVDKRKDISEVEAMLYEAKKDPAKLTDELIKTVLQKMENNSYEASEKSKADDEALEDKKEEKEVEDAKECSDKCDAKDECGSKEESKDEAKAEVKEEAPTEEKKDKEEDKKEEAKAEDKAIAALDALPEILAKLERIENSLKGRSESETIYSLDESPVQSTEMDLGLKKYLGE